MSDSRLFKIIYYLLEKGWATAPELAGEFEVSVRTIYRDVEALSGAGIPVYTETGRKGGIALLDSFVLDKALLSGKEKENILTALQSMPGMENETENADTLTKLSALFGLHVENWMEADFSRWGKESGDNAKFESLKTAVIHHKTIKIVYESSTSGRSERKVQPLKICYKSKEWYLKAFCLARQDFRLFKLNRILSLELLEETFIPMAYPKTEEEEQETARIVLLFSKEVAYRVYDEFDEDQISRQENGDCLVTAQMPVSPWLVGYLLSFGTETEIIEPAYLRETVAEQAKGIYEKNN